LTVGSVSPVRIDWVVGGGATVVVGGATLVVGGSCVVVGGCVVVVGGSVVVVVVVRVVVGVVVVVVVVVGDVVLVVVVGAVVVVVGVTVDTVGSPLLPVTVIVCGTGAFEGVSPGLVTRVVVVVGVLSVLVRVMASPPTVTAASAAAIPKSNGGRRYQGTGADTNSVSESGSISAVGRESGCGTE
jgi:hypothetical protein